MKFHDFLLENKRWLTGAMLLMLASSAGQTIIIAQHSAHIRKEFDLGHGDFGLIYMLGTLASAAALIWVGKSVDRFRPVTVGIASLILLAGFSLLMSFTPNVFFLGFAIFGLRLFGQGMLPQTAITAIGRWYRLRRGKAIAVSTLGLVLGEAVLPITVVSSILYFGWRQTWIMTALVLVSVFLPAIWFLLNRERQPQSSIDDLPVGNKYEIPNWTRRQVLHDWRFWMVSMGLLVAPFITTGILFHQVHIAEFNSWGKSVIPASLPILAFSGAVFSFLSGVLIDRIGAPRTILPALLLLGMGTATLGLADHTAYIPVAFFLLGAGGGSLGTINGAIWAELYGVRYLGSIRAVAFAGITFSTSLSPGLMGWFIDRGISINYQLIVASCFTVLVCIAIYFITPYLIARNPSCDH